MQIADLFESTSTEMAMNRAVRRASRIVLDRIYRGQQPYNEIELSGYGDYFVYRSREDFGLYQNFLLMLGVRQSIAVCMSVMVMVFGQDVFGYQTGMPGY